MQYPDLKTRVCLAEAATLPEAQSSSPTFVDFLAPSPLSRCVIEFKGAREFPFHRPQADSRKPMRPNPRPWPLTRPSHHATQEIGGLPPA